MEIRRFLVAVWSDWLARMSGPLTVPFTIAAFFVPSAVYRVLFATLAVVAALLTCYRIWAKEYERAESVTSKLDAIERAQPRLMLKEPGAIYCESVTQTFRDVAGRIVKQRVDRFLKVRFINNPGLSVPSSKATGVIATIDYYRCSDSAHVLSLDGRWSESTQPSGISPLESKIHLLSATFLQGQQRSLDVAFCDGESGKYYAWNNDNYNPANEFFVYPAHALIGDRFTIRIRLRADFVDEIFSFSFRTEDCGFVIEPTQPK
jgi:hypothetical protein